MNRQGCWDQHLRSMSHDAAMPASWLRERPLAWTRPDRLDATI